MIKAIIFDMDGVVIDTEPLYEQGDRDFFTLHSVTDNLEVFKHLLTGKSLEDGMQIMQKLYGIKGDIPDLVKQRLDIFKKYFKNIKFHPGFLDFYNLIKPHYKTAIATSSHAELFAIEDECLNLTELFHNHVYFLKDAGNKSKPDPAIFLHTANMLETDPQECLVIEDAVNGVKAAKNAGMKCVALATTHDVSLLKEADVIVKTFSEINLDHLNTL